MIARIADTLRTRGTHWILINFPMSPKFKGTVSYSPDGPSWPTARDVLQQIRNIETSNFFFHLYDANNDGNHDYDSLDFIDEYHLSGKGADKIGRRTDSVIHTILP